MTLPLDGMGAGIGLLPTSYRYLVERARCALDDISIVTDRIRYLDRAEAVLHEEAHS